jgi:hypothetical protein
MKMAKGKIVGSGITLGGLAVLCASLMLENARSERARVRSTQFSLHAVLAAVKEYEADVGQYPPTDKGLTALVEWYNSQPHGPLCHARPTTDAWGNGLRYRVVKGRPWVESPGRDGTFDTADDIHEKK